MLIVTCTNVQSKTKVAHKKLKGSQFIVWRILVIIDFFADIPHIQSSSWHLSALADGGMLLFLQTFSSSFDRRPQSSARSTYSETLRNGWVGKCFSVSFCRGSIFNQTVQWIFHRRHLVLRCFFLRQYLTALPLHVVGSDGADVYRANLWWTWRPPMVSCCSFRRDTQGPLGASVGV